MSSGRGQSRSGRTTPTRSASAALRLASVGQQGMQKVLSEVLGRVPEVVDQILRAPSRRLTSFVPMMDVCQMEHRHLYSRLFRS